MTRSLRLAVLTLTLGCATPTDDTQSESVVQSDETNRGGECAFNRECPADQRCECDGACACADGTRGTGVNGVDTCTEGNDCASSICVEGSGPEFYCTDECVDASDCAPALPQCLDVAFVGRICVRDAT